MIKKWIFAAGAGIGYVLGTRAGREKYNQMADQARQLMNNPKVKEAQHEAAKLYDEGKQVVHHKMRKLSERNGHMLEDARVGARSEAGTTYASPSPVSPTNTTPTGPVNAAQTRSEPTSP